MELADFPRHLASVLFSLCACVCSMCVCVRWRCGGQERLIPRRVKPRYFFKDNLLITSRTSDRSAALQAGGEPNFSIEQLGRKLKATPNR